MQLMYNIIPSLNPIILAKTTAFGPQNIEYDDIGINQAVALNLEFITLRTRGQVQLQLLN